MSDIIKLLPDSVANQIAAGEVVQRPASVVKELLENSVDAGATDIKLIVKDAGRTLIQVTDNGKGMSENDARMCFERHATSKITQAQDLFALTTMGFRGEALASIASVSRVELKTRMAENPLGTEIVIEGSKTEWQEPCQCPVGTTIAVKNLFFNTPARRNFLKSDNVEKSHLFNEFLRVALAHPHIAFSYYHNNQLTTQTSAGNLGNRILGLFGNHYKQRLIPIEESTLVIDMKGYILKPEFAKKRKNEQFVFVNNRFIKSPYLNHAIENAFEELIPSDSFPSFFVFLEIDPSQIDVNVHPTKTEIKFQDEKTIYQILKAAVRKSLGKFNIAPSIDFEQEAAFRDLNFDKNRPVTIPQVQINPDYNPFRQGAESLPGNKLNTKTDLANWEKLFPDPRQKQQKTLFTGTQTEAENEDDALSKNRYRTVLKPKWDEEEEKPTLGRFMQLHGKYILTTVKSGLMVIDQHRAHERILFEKHIKILANQKSSSQTLLFPEPLKFNEADAALFEEVRDELTVLGFDISDFRSNTYMINAIPAYFPENENLQQLMELFLENYRKNNKDLVKGVHANLARSMAKSLSVKVGKIMEPEEMNALTDNLFSCEMPYQTPGGKPVFTLLPMGEIADKFK